jgi:hypothetical protein
MVGMMVDMLVAKSVKKKVQNLVGWKVEMMAYK